MIWDGFLLGCGLLLACFAFGCLIGLFAVLFGR